MNRSPGPHRVRVCPAGTAIINRLGESTAAEIEVGEFEFIWEAATAPADGDNDLIQTNMIEGFEMAFDEKLADRVRR